VSFRPPLADHPRLGALAAFLTGLLCFGVANPSVTHEPARWPDVITSSVLLALFVYLARTTRSGRFLPLTLIGVSVLALGVYWNLVKTRGVPHGENNRLIFASMIATPLAGLAMASWLLLRHPHGNK